MKRINASTALLPLLAALHVRTVDHVVFPPIVEGNDTRSVAPQLSDIQQRGTIVVRLKDGAVLRFSQPAMGRTTRSV